MNNLGMVMNRFMMNRFMNMNRSMNMFDRFMICGFRFVNHWLKAMLNMRWGNWSMISRFRGMV